MTYRLLVLFEIRYKSYGSEYWKSTIILASLYTVLHKCIVCNGVNECHLSSPILFLWANIYLCIHVHVFILHSHSVVWLRPKNQRQTFIFCGQGIIPKIFQLKDLLTWLSKPICFYSKFVLNTVHASCYEILKNMLHSDYISVLFVVMVNGFAS